MAKNPKRPKSSDRIRKIGEGEETILEDLNEEQRAEERANALRLMSQLDKVEAELAQVKLEYKAKTSALKQKIKDSRSAADTGVRKVDVVIDDFLTSSNEVIRMRRDTGEQVGDARRARAEELQENLFPDRREEDSFVQ